MRSRTTSATAAWNRHCSTTHKGQRTAQLNRPHTAHKARADFRGGVVAASCDSRRSRSRSSESTPSTDLLSCESAMPTRACTGTVSFRLRYGAALTRHSRSVSGLMGSRRAMRVASCATIAFDRNGHSLLHPTQAELRSTLCVRVPDEGWTRATHSPDTGHSNSRYYGRLAASH